MTRNGERRTSALRIQALVALAALALAGCGGGGAQSSSSDGTATTAAPGQGGGRAVPGAQACPDKPLAFAPPTPWQAIGQVPNSGATSPQPIYESKVVVTNPNSLELAVRAKAVLTGSVVFRDFGGGTSSIVKSRLVTYGVAVPGGGNRIDGKDIEIRAVSPAPVPAGGTVELVARVVVEERATVATAALYGRGSLAGTSQAEIDRCEIAIAGAEPMRLLDGAQPRGQAAAPTACPDKPVQVTGPDDWQMTRNFAGQQTWQGTAKVTNPNSADVVVVMARSFALATVTRADGSTFTGYSGPLSTALPANSGIGGQALVLAGKTIEVTTSVEVLSRQRSRRRRRTWT